MKNSAFSLLFLILAPLVFGEEVFRVSKVGKDKTMLRRVFKEIQSLDYAARAPKESRFEVFQRFDSQNYLVKSPGGRKLYWLVLLQERELVDGDIFSTGAAQTGKTREYVTILGAKATVSELEERELQMPDLLTEKDFVAQLKNGKTWTLRRFVENECRRCFGDGELSVMKNHEKCPDCKGRGSTVEDVLVKW